MVTMDADTWWTQCRTYLECWNISYKNIKRRIVLRQCVLLLQAAVSNACAPLRLQRGRGAVCVQWPRRPIPCDATSLCKSVKKSAAAAPFGETCGRRCGRRWSMQGGPTATWWTPPCCRCRWCTRSGR